jgi:hypothetical protein
MVRCDHRPDVSFITSQAIPVWQVRCTQATPRADEHRKIMGKRAPIREVRKHPQRDRPNPTGADADATNCDDFPTAARG